VSGKRRALWLVLDLSIKSINSGGKVELAFTQDELPKTLTVQKLARNRSFVRVADCLWTARAFDILEKVKRARRTLDKSQSA
jgi:hypothetical protein